jgi:hypothetical protein
MCAPRILTGTGTFVPIIPSQRRKNTAEAILLGCQTAFARKKNSIAVQIWEKRRQMAKLISMAAQFSILVTV